MTRPTPEKHPCPVSIITTGACTSVGYTAPTTAASIRAGINRIACHPFMVDMRGGPFITARAKYLPDLLIGIERLWQLVLLAANEALAVIRASHYETRKIPVVIGLANMRPGFTETMEKQIREHFEKFNHPFYTFTPVHTICAGHSAGLMALEKGCDIIRQRLSPVCLAGGIDSWIDPDALEWLDSEQAIYTHENPWGFVPSEGAGFCLLAEDYISRVVDTPAKAHILAGVTTREKDIIHTDTVCTGQGLTQAISLATNHSKAPIDQLICDLNGQRYRADEFGFAMARTSDRFKTPGDFLSPATFWGDAGAACGPLFISLAVHTALQGNAKGPLSLILTSSDTGQRSAMLIETLQQPGEKA
jgi:3-oxoacyl-[acyl-carrier-protein] synthase-1